MESTFVQAPGRRRWLVAAGLAAAGALLPRAAMAAFDHGHAAWTALLKANVVLASDGHASTVRYGGFQQQRAGLDDCLASLSAVTPAEYDGWSKPQRLAFLINAYNAFTVDLVLTKYPNLQSIKDLGGFLQSPWKNEFFRLLGQSRSLDGVEHGLIRAPGAFAEPRIHFAVNCASIGCPMLRAEAYVADRLDAQLADATQRFLSDRSRNRYEPQTQRLAVSRLLDWYGKDFAQGHDGIGSLKTYFARHAAALGESAADQQAIRAGGWRLDFSDYDWALNDAR